MSNFSSTASEQFPTLTNHSDIKAWLDQYDVKNYTILPDGSVNVNDDVNLNDKKLEFLPVKFNEVGGNFSCGNNLLTSLFNCPTTVEGYFFGVQNQLTSLQHAPVTVGKHFSCAHNQLVSLIGSPSSISGLFNCSNNNLTSLEFAPQSVRDFNCSFNSITSLQFCPESVGRNFNCAHNQLTSLLHAPRKTGSFRCSENFLISLQHVPSEIDGALFCSHNNLKEIDFLPEFVSFIIDLSQNPLLGDIQHITNFSEIKAIYKQQLHVKSEKDMLFSNTLSTPLISNHSKKHKI